MKINKQDEYGLRILLRIARADSKEGLSIPQLSELEGISQPYVGKIARALRMNKLVESTPGQKGGYILAKPADQITIKEIIDALGGSLFPVGFCGSHTGQLSFCTNSVDCSVRSLWKTVHLTMNHVLSEIHLSDLLDSENATNNKLSQIISQVLPKDVVERSNEEAMILES